MSPFVRFDNGEIVNRAAKVLKKPGVNSQGC
jgi:hypothetical protein